MSGDGPLFCSHEISWDVYCPDCDAEAHDPLERPGLDPRREYADSVGMPLHDKI